CLKLWKVAHFLRRLRLKLSSLRRSVRGASFTFSGLMSADSADSTTVSRRPAASNFSRPSLASISISETGAEGLVAPDLLPHALRMPASRRYRLMTQQQHQELRLSGPSNVERYVPSQPPSLASSVAGDDLAEDQMMSMFPHHGSLHHSQHLQSQHQHHSINLLSPPTPTGGGQLLSPSIHLRPPTKRFWNRQLRARRRCSSTTCITISSSLSLCQRQLRLLNSRCTAAARRGDSAVSAHDNRAAYKDGSVPQCRGIPKAKKSTEQHYRLLDNSLYNVTS
uniref:Pecanex-like protein n=1 Tax=Macrostomum lignano TaxID=282301 RepID=A0A1I8FSV2_9PLAT